MKFGVFYELQLPKPWNEGDEQRLFHEALEQIVLADRLGFDHAWKWNITSSTNIRIPPRRKCFSRRRRPSRRTSASATASAR